MFLSHLMMKVLNCNFYICYWIPMNLMLNHERIKNEFILILFISCLYSSLILTVVFISSKLQTVETHFGESRRARNACSRFFRRLPSCNSPVWKLRDSSSYQSSKKGGSQKYRLPDNSHSQLRQHIYTIYTLYDLSAFYHAYIFAQ